VITFGLPVLDVEIDQRQTAALRNRSRSIGYVMELSMEHFAESNFD